MAARARDALGIGRGETAGVMGARLVAVLAVTDLTQAWRRMVALGPARVAGTVVAGVALVAGEVWIVDLVAVRLLAAADGGFGATILSRGAAMVAELAMMVAAASAVTVALPVIESVETDPWSAASPLPRPHRALQVWWRVAAGLGWVVVLALPPLLTLGHHLSPGAATMLRQLTGSGLLLGTAAAAGCAVALVLAALVPRRILLPLSWTATTAAVVGAVLWLRHLHPERLVTATDPTQLFDAMTATGPALAPAGPRTWVTGSLTGAGSLTLTAAVMLASVGLLVALWIPLSHRAAIRLTTGTPGHSRPWKMWAILDRTLVRGALGALVSSRLRLLLRDLTQASQTLYLLGLGAVYVENLRSLPLADPLARELAGLINLAMAGLLTAALAMRFAYPAHLLEGESHWWWSTGPVSPARAQVAAIGVAAIPPLVLSGGLFFASLAVIGPCRTTAVGWWLVPWQAVWLTVLGVTLGPRAAGPRHTSWVDAALGSGGILFLAVAMAGVGWTVVASGRRVIAEVLRELAITWDPGLLLGHPALVAALLTLVTAGVVTWQVSSSRG